MNVELKMGPKFELLQAGLRKAPAVTLSAIAEGLGAATKDTADAVARAILSGSTGLKSRSGTLAGAIINYPDASSDLTWYIGVGDNEKVLPYAYLLTDEQPVIKPKNGVFLSIPSGANEDGVLFKSPRDVQDGFFIHKSGSVFFGDSQGDQFRLLFTMVKEVLVQGFGVLPDVVRKESRYLSGNIMVNKLRRTIRHRLSEAGITDD